MKTKYLIGKLVSSEGNHPLGYLVGEVSFKGDGTPSIVGSLGVKELISESEIGEEVDFVQWLKGSFKYKEFNLDRLPVYEGSAENLSSSGLKLIKTGDIRLIMLYDRTVYYLNEFGRIKYTIFSTDEGIRDWVNRHKVLFACALSRDLNRLCKYVTVEGKMLGDEEYKKREARNRLTHEDCGLYSVESTSGLISLSGFSQCYNSVCKLGSFLEEARIIGREVRESGIEVLDMSECRQLRNLEIYSVDAKVILPESVDNPCKVAIEIGSTVPDGFSKFVSNKNVNLTISANNVKLGNIGDADSLEFNCTSAKLSDVKGLPKKVSINCSDRILVTGCHDIEELTINLSDDGEARVYNCENLRRATIFGFKSLSVLELEGLFLNCPKLEEIELSCAEFSPSGSINRSELAFKRRLLTINGITGGNVKRFSLNAERCTKYAEYHYHEPVIYTLGDTKHIVSENIQQFFADYKASAELAELLRFSRLFSVLERDSGELFLAGNQLYIDSRVCVDMFNRLSRNSSVFSGDVFNIPKEIRYLEQFNCDGFYNIRSILVSSALALREKAFYSSKVEEIVGSEYIDEISRYSFSGSSIKRIVISDKIACIPDYAFSGCGELREVEFLGETRVGTMAFLGCSALSEESLKEIWKRGAGKDSEFIFEVLFAGDWKSLADKTMPIMPEHLKYTYAIYRLVSIYGKESLSATMTNGRDDLFSRDLSVLLSRRSEVEADIRERFKTRGKGSEDTLVCERAAQELFQDYGKFMREAVGDSETIPTGHEKKEEWEKLGGFQQGSL